MRTGPFEASWGPRSSSACVEEEVQTQPFEGLIDLYVSSCCPSLPRCPAILFGPLSLGDSAQLKILTSFPGSAAEVRRLPAVPGVLHPEACSFSTALRQRVHLPSRYVAGLLLLFFDPATCFKVRSSFGGENLQMDMVWYDFCSPCLQVLTVLNDSPKYLPGYWRGEV